MFMRAAVDFRPLLEFVVRPPALSLRFVSPIETDSQLPFDITFTQDLNGLLNACRSNEALAGHIKDCVLRSIEFYPKTIRNTGAPNSHLNTQIQIDVQRKYKQLWMDGTHSFDELHHTTPTIAEKRLPALILPSGS